MIYMSGVLTRINYASGNYKTFSYGTGGELVRIDYTKGAVTTRRTITYTPEGNVASITDTVV